MKHFHLIADGFDVAPAVQELWTIGGAGAPLDESIGLTGRVDPEPAGVRVLYTDGQAEVYTNGLRFAGAGGRFSRHPAIQRLHEQALATLGNRVGPLHSARVRVLPPHSRMRAHRDDLDKMQRKFPGRARYQLAMQCDEKAVFTIRTGVTKAEKCSFKPGELWHVDIGGRTHLVVNDSDLPRVVMVVDCY